MGIEPIWPQWSAEFKSASYTYSDISAIYCRENPTQTDDLLNANQAFYQLNYFPLYYRLWTRRGLNPRVTNYGFYCLWGRADTSPNTKNHLYSQTDGLNDVLFRPGLISVNFIVSLDDFCTLVRNRTWIYCLAYHTMLPWPNRHILSFKCRASVLRIICHSPFKYVNASLYLLLPWPNTFHRCAHRLHQQYFQLSDNATYQFPSVHVCCGLDYVRTILELLQVI